MSRLPIALPLLLLLAALPAQKKKLTFEQVSGGRGGVRFSAQSTVRWAGDGVHLLVREGRQFRLVHPDHGDVEKKPSAVDRRPSGARRVGRRRGRTRGPRVANGKLTSLSPDKRYISFVREHDLWVRDTKSEKEWELTSEGSPDLLHGELDWVYQEEVYGRGRFRAHWWSPDSKWLALLRLEEGEVPVFTIANPVPRDLTKRPNVQYQPKVTEQRYPKPGQANPGVALGVVARSGGKVKWIDLSSWPRDCLVVRVAWRKDRNTVLFMVQDRIQTWLDLVEADPESGKVHKLIHETAPGWTNRLPMPRWLADGSFLWESERTGYRHIYHYTSDAKLERPVTSGEWAVTSITHVDEKNGVLEFTATKDGAVDRNYYSIGFDGRGLTRLTSDRGTHSLTWNKQRTLAIDAFSSLAEPTRMRVVDTKGKVRRDFGQVRIPALSEYAVGKWYLHEIPARDGYAIDAALLKPPEWQAGKRYPIWLPTYSGPNAPSVRNSWNGSAWNHFLAQQGFLVLQVNVRSASGKGKKVIAACYKQLGVSELQDLEDAVDWVCKNHGGDPERVGFTGWSYGGFMSAYAACYSKKFRLAVAGAGVYDWRLYDTIYTERYMQTPAMNAEGYRRTSCILGAKNLHGHLLLLHGTEDDNVHFQNCMQFVYALQQAGKDFEMMIFPNAMHGPLRFQGQQRTRMTWRAMQRHLLSNGRD